MQPATDNCGVQSVVRTAGPASGSVFPIGTTYGDLHRDRHLQQHVVVQLYGDRQDAGASCARLDSRERKALQPPLTGQQAQGLVSKLNQALTSINSQQYPSACGKLADYVTQVQNYINNGTLTSAQGSPLIVSANKVRKHDWVYEQPVHVSTIE
jgi:hypothetical protein